MSPEEAKKFLEYDDEPEMIQAQNAKKKPAEDDLMDDIEWVIDFWLIDNIKELSYTINSYLALEVLFLARIEEGWYLSRSVARSRYSWRISLTMPVAKCGGGK